VLCAVVDVVWSQDVGRPGLVCCVRL
jgi:hypothetical protein